jgi:LmbE family N-acetylglucosaminyl deacetylase
MHLFLSPHLDDAVLSTGGIVDAVVRTGERAVVATFCTADPPENLDAIARDLHARWGNPPDPYGDRRREDAAACALLGAEERHLGLRDAIYRGRFGAFTELFGPIPERDRPFGAVVVAALEHVVRELAPVAIYAPLAVGLHVDHQHVLAAAKGLLRGAPLFFYEDQPYSSGIYGRADTVERALTRVGVPVVAEPRPIDLSRKMAAIRCYKSQLDELFGADLAGLEALASYAGATERVWRAS